MKYKFFTFVLFCLLVLSVSCDTRKVFENQPSENQIAATDDEQDATLKSNRELWTKSRICSYKMTLEAFIFSPTKFASPVNLEIQDGNILNVEEVSPSKEKLTPAQIEFIKNQYKNSTTIEKLFDIASSSKKEERELIEKGSSNALKVEISYDPQYGYPQKIKTRTSTPDSGYMYAIKTFEVLKSQNDCQ
ncbi:MAG TPA: DUF6174 domain-containing protein [Pyrinomonadaceae bacterium]|nr:DUF6174 domain-containing protein [Pyrinomonadaceae bacterium]